MSEHLITHSNLADVVADIGSKVVKNKPQTLTDAQKAQVRQNINAASQAELNSLGLSVKNGKLCVTFTM